MRHPGTKIHVEQSHVVFNKILLKHIGRFVNIIFDYVHIVLAKNQHV
jgi:hypothetical protein